MDIIEPIRKESDEVLKQRDIEQKQLLYPVKIDEKIWKFLVYGYNEIEIYVYDKLPTRETLFKLDLSKEAIENYVTHKNYESDVSGRCKHFMDGNRSIIIVSLNNLDEETFYNKIAIATHEFNHCAHRILESKENFKNLRNYEESHCYIQDWLMETYLCINLNNADFSKLYNSRDLIWFHVITNN